MASVGRVWARDRYLSPEHVSARVAVLGSNSLPHQDVHEGSPTGLELIEDPGFKEVPHAALDPKDVEPLCARPCNHAEDIMLVEARAVLWGLERIGVGPDSLLLPSRVPFKASEG